MGDFLVLFSEKIGEEKWSNCHALPAADSPFFAYTAVPMPHVQKREIN